MTLLAKLRGVLGEARSNFPPKPEPKPEIDAALLARVKTKILTFVAGHSERDDWTNYTLQPAMMNNRVIREVPSSSLEERLDDDGGYHRAYWQALEDLLAEGKIWVSSSWHEDDGKNFFIRQRRE